MTVTYLMLRPPIRPIRPKRPEEKPQGTTLLVVLLLPVLLAAFASFSYCSGQRRLFRNQASAALAEVDRAPASIPAAPSYAVQPEPYSSRARAPRIGIDTAAILHQIRTGEPPVRSARPLRDVEALVIARQYLPRTYNARMKSKARPVLYADGRSNEPATPILVGRQGGERRLLLVGHRTKRVLLDHQF